MGDLHDANHAASQLQRARELLAQGQHQEALALALDALQAVLHNLREALLNLQQNLAQVSETKNQADPTQQELEALATLLRDPKFRTYH